MRAIHVLAVCQYHIHHLPVHHCCASKSLTPLLIYNLNFEVHPVYSWILVFFIASSLIWLPVLSPNHAIWLPVLFLSVFWRGPPFFFKIWQLLLCFMPLFPHYSVELARERADLIWWRSSEEYKTHCSVNNLMGNFGQICLDTNTKTHTGFQYLWQNVVKSKHLATHSHVPLTPWFTFSLSLALAFYCAQSSHKGKKLSVTLNKKPMNCSYKTSPWRA